MLFRSRGDHAPDDQGPRPPAGGPPPAAAAPEPDPDEAAIQNGGLGPGSSGGCGARGPGGGRRNGCGDLSEAHGAASRVLEPHRAGVAGQVRGARAGVAGLGWGRTRRGAGRRSWLGQVRGAPGGGRRSELTSRQGGGRPRGRAPAAACAPRDRPKVGPWGAPGQGEARRQEPWGRLKGPGPECGGTSWGGAAVARWPRAKRSHAGEGPCRPRGPLPRPTSRG